MKKVLMFQMVTVAGAGTYAANVISEDGQIKNLPGWVANKDYGICKIIPMGANGDYVTFSRSSHQADNLTFVQPADTLADYDKVIDIAGGFNNQGIEIKANETLTLTSTVTGNATINVLVELDDAIKKVNARASRIIGAAPAVANTPTETGSNVSTNMNPNSEYRVRMVSLKSTTIQTAFATLKGASIALPGSNAILTGQGYSTLSAEQAKVLTGTGADYQSTFNLYITTTAADAAAVQILYFVYETV